MQTLNLRIKTNQKILALGAELDSSFAYYNNGKVVISENTENAANNPVLLEKKINAFVETGLKPVSEAETGFKPVSEAETGLKPVSTTPDCILTDLNPEYNAVKIGAKLAKKWKIPHIKIQHHIAHIFTVITEHYLLDQPEQTEMPNQFIGIACDGTGYGADGTIWGGEIMLVQSSKFQVQSIERIGHLEQQILIGGQMAIEEPARVLMAILAKFSDEEELYKIINKFYNPKISKLLYSQLQQNFNCQKTTSCARVLDAASALLFGCNERKFKHQAAKILEENSSEPYDDIQPTIMTSSGGVRGGLENKKWNKTDDSSALRLTRRSPLTGDCGGANFLGRFGDVAEPTQKVGEAVMPRGSLPLGDSRALPQNNISILRTTPLFEYLIKNLNYDKKRLAATVHQYIANGLFEIAKKLKTKKENKIIFSGGMANNKIFRKYFEEKNALLNQQIEPGDPGISLGQIGWYLMSYNTK